MRSRQRMYEISYRRGLTSEAIRKEDDENISVSRFTASSNNMLFQQRLENILNDPLFDKHLSIIKEPIEKILKILRSYPSVYPRWVESRIEKWEKVLNLCRVGKLRPISQFSRPRAKSQEKRPILEDMMGPKVSRPPVSRREDEEV